MQYTQYGHQSTTPICQSSFKAITPLLYFKVSYLPQHIGGWLQRFSPIQPLECYQEPRLRLVDKVWLTVSVQVNAKGVRWD